MLKKILITWAVANFGLVGLASWIAGEWYLGWNARPVIGMLAELGLIVLPNLILPLLVLRYWWSEPVDSLRNALAWRWKGWRSLVSGLLAFLVFYIMSRAVAGSLGSGIPYHLPGASGGGIAITQPDGILKIIAILIGLAAFIGLTVAGEETMFRGWIQTQVGKRYSIGVGLISGVILFGLRHLPADLFYAQIWQATPQMWLSRQFQLYLLAALLGLSRLFGKSTYAPAITHALVFAAALFGLA